MRKKQPPKFGELLRAYRQRADLTMNDISRQVPMDAGLLSKIERNLRPPPRLPRVRMIAKALGFPPDSRECRQLVEAAWEARYDENERLGISEILTVVPRGRSSAGLGGLPPQTIQQGVPIFDMPSKPAAEPLLDLSGPAANIPTADILNQFESRADQIFQTILTARNWRVTQFSQRGEMFTASLHLPNGEDYRIKARITRISSPDGPPKSTGDRRQGALKSAKIPSAALPQDRTYE